MAGLLDSIKNKMAQANEEYKARQEYIKEMSRGFDVLPDSHKTKCGAVMSAKRTVHLIFSGIFLAASIIAYGYFKDYPTLKGFIIAFMVITALITLRNLRLLMRFSVGAFDLFGGFLLNKDTDYKRNSRYVDMYGNLRHEYSGTNRRYLPYGTGKGAYAGYDVKYSVNINGVQCRVTSTQYKALRQDCYYYVMRFKGKYVTGDSFFFMKTDSSVADQRVGNHFPADENRNPKSRRRSAIGIMLIVFGVLGLIISGIFFAMERSGIEGIQNAVLSTGGVGAGLVLLGVIANMLKK